MPQGTFAPRQHIARPKEQAKQALYDTVSKSKTTPTFKRHHGVNPKDAAMSFIYLTESQVGQPSGRPTSPPQTPRKAIRPRQGGAQDVSASPRADAPRIDGIDRANRLFEILSSRSDIDHPICIECTDMLVDGLQKKLDAATKERDTYALYLKEARANQPTDGEKRRWREAQKQAEQAKAQAMEQLKKLEAEKDRLDLETLALEEEARQLDKEEEEFWAQRNDFTAKMSDFQSERDSINTKYVNDSQLLQKLQRSNVYNDTFCISHDGSFATINGLRLGRLSNKPVDWPEINAAWGHALLLLVTVAEKLDFKFQGYDPQPMGSTSKIVRFETASPASSRLGSRTAAQGPPKKQVLELYSSGDMPLGLTFMHRKFDNAMVAFLELVRQLGIHVYRQTEPSGRPLSLPYKIEGDRIGDTSIKLGIAQDDGWTKACKLTLTCCKFLLAHASNISSPAQDPE